MIDVEGPRLTMASDTPGQVVLGCIRKKTEKDMISKPVLENLFFVLLGRRAGMFEKLKPN